MAGPHGVDLHSTRLEDQQRANAAIALRRKAADGRAAGASGRRAGGVAGGMGTALGMSAGVGAAQPGAAAGVGRVGDASRHARMHERPGLRATGAAVPYMDRGGEHGSATSSKQRNKLSDTEWQLRHQIDLTSDRY